jgi:hypothetical protein
MPVDTYCLTEVIHKSRNTLAFQIVLLKGNGERVGWMEPFEIQHAFEWLEKRLAGQTSVHVTIKGDLGQDVDKEFISFTTPHSVIRQVWKAWQTQAAQSRAAIVRQKVMTPR